MMLTRRNLLQSTASGFGYLAFAALAHEATVKDARAADPLAPIRQSVPPGHLSGDEDRGWRGNRVRCPLRRRPVICFNQSETDRLN
jgi:hypothetical protein